MNIRPLKNRIVVKPIEREEQTAGGIFLPDTAKEKPQTGEIVAVGPGEYVEETGKVVPPSLEVGEKVFYGKYAGTDVTVMGNEFKILDVKDVLAKFV